MIASGHDHDDHFVERMVMESTVQYWEIRICLVYFSLKIKAAMLNDRPTAEIFVH